MKRYQVTVNGERYEVSVEELDTAAPAASFQKAPAAASQAQPSAPDKQAPSAGGGKEVPSPMPGVILDVRVKEGQEVKSGDVLVVLEAMKMENDIVAPVDGKVTSVQVKKGDTVESNQTIVTIL